MGRNMLRNAAPIAVLLLVVTLLIAFHALPPKHSTGFFVRLAPARCPAEEDSDATRLIILRITNGGTLYINSEQEQWNTLETRLSEIYSPRVYRTLYVFAEDGVPFQAVANAIDIVENTHTSVPPHRNDRENLGVTVKLVTPAAINAPCPQPVVTSGSQRMPR